MHTSNDHTSVSLTERWRTWLPGKGNILLALIVVLLLRGPQVGATPAAPQASTNTIPYQGRLADPAGRPLSGSYAMTFRLYAAASGGTALWTEARTGANSIPVSDGLFNVLLGSVQAIPGAVIAGNANLWLGITVGTDAELTPRIQLGAVPFAIQALTVPDGSIDQAKAPNLLEAPMSPYTNVFFGHEGVSAATQTSRLSKVVSVPIRCGSNNDPKVFIQPFFSHYDDISATIGEPFDAGQFKVFLFRSDGGFWQAGQVQEFSWMAVCG